MPQLDKFVFMSQVIWLLVFLWGSYFILIGTGLKSLYRVMKIRSFILDKKEALLVSSLQEFVSSNKLFNNYIKNIFKFNEELLEFIGENVVKVIYLRLSKIYSLQFVFILDILKSGVSCVNMSFSNRTGDVGFLVENNIYFPGKSVFQIRKTSW